MLASATRPLSSLILATKQQQSYNREHHAKQPKRGRRLFEEECACQPPSSRRQPREWREPRRVARLSEKAERKRRAGVTLAVLIASPRSDYGDAPTIAGETRTTA